MAQKTEGNRQAAINRPKTKGQQTVLKTINDKSSNCANKSDYNGNGICCFIHCLRRVKRGRGNALKAG